MSGSQNFQVSDNTRAQPSFDAAPAITDSVMNDVGMNYMRDAKDLNSSTIGSGNNDSSTANAQDTINSGLNNTDKLYGSLLNATTSDAPPAPLQESQIAERPESPRSSEAPRWEHGEPVASSNHPEMSLARSAGGG